MDKLQEKSLDKTILMYTMPDMSPTTKDCGYIQTESLPSSWQKRLNEELPQNTDIWMVDYFKIRGGLSTPFLNVHELVKQALDSGELSKAGAIRVYSGSWRLEKRRPFTLVDLTNSLLSENTLYHPENLAFISHPRLNDYLGKLGLVLGYKVKNMGQLS